MSEPVHIQLSRANQSQSWGFRLQGGADFAAQLSIQSVVPGSISNQCGITAGDSILQIGNVSTDTISHEEAKQEIMRCGDVVNLVVQRGTIKVWAPKVTPMSELRGQQMQAPQGGNQPVEDSYIQRTSLAADKQDSTKINFYNRSARPFAAGGGSSFGGGAPAPAPASPADKMPVVVNAQYNTPISMYSTNNALDAFEQQSSSMGDDMSSLALGTSGTDGNETNNNDSQAADDKPKKTTVLLKVEDSTDEAIKRGPSPTFRAIHGLQTDTPPRSASPSFLKLHNMLQEDNSGTVRSASPTLLAVHEEKSGRHSPKTSARYTETKEGEEIRYQGYTNPNAQSRSFQLLQQGLGSDGGAQHAPAAAPPSGGGAPAVSGMRSVRAPTGPPSNVQIQQAQHMICKACGSLIVGVFVKVKGESMHAECYKCVRCRKSLKNQGFFTVEGQLHCEPCAAQVSAPPGDMVSTAVYR